MSPSVPRASTTTHRVARRCLTSGRSSRRGRRMGIAGTTPMPMRDGNAADTFWNLPHILYVRTVASLVNRLLNIVYYLASFAALYYHSRPNSRDGWSSPATSFSLPRPALTSLRPPSHLPRPLMSGPTPPSAHEPVMHSSPGFLPFFHLPRSALFVHRISSFPTSVGITPTPPRNTFPLLRER